MSDTTNLPQSISLDLDALARKPEEIIEPFRVNVAGRVIEMADPQDIDWQDLAFMESPLEFLRFCVGPDDRDFLFEQRLPGWKMKALMESYQKHYKVDQIVERHRREQRQQAAGLRSV